MTLLTEGWPLFGALALVAVITYGALRPHLKGPKPPRDTEKETDDER